MDILTAVHHAASRLRDAIPDTDAASGPDTASPAAPVLPPVSTIVAEAAETGEAAALALVHLGDVDDATAYLAAANAFALVRIELENAQGVAPMTWDDLLTHTGDESHDETYQDALDWDAAETDPVMLESALVDVAAAIISMLAAAMTRLGDPDQVVVLSRAGLAAADAYRALHREPSDVRHLR